MRVCAHYAQIDANNRYLTKAWAAPTPLLWLSGGGQARVRIVGLLIQITRRRLALCDCNHGIPPGQAVGRVRSTPHVLESRRA